jgi:hypothetical protein
VVRDAGSGARVVVVVVCFGGVDVDTGAMFSGQVFGGWYVAGVGGGVITVVVSIVGCSMVCVVVMVDGFL